MTDRITIDINLHPLAWKVLKNEYDFDGKAVDVGKGWLYYLILQGLEREQVVIPYRDKSRLPKNLVKGKVYIYYEDSLRYGQFLRLPRQANISRVLVSKFREKICQTVAVFHIATGIDRNKVMRRFLENEDVEEEEMSFEALKKHYQRHYRHKEKDLLQYINELKD